jgi:hypothetical protein
MTSVSATSSGSYINSLTFQTLIDTIIDAEVSDETRLRAAQELSSSFEVFLKL